MPSSTAPFAQYRPYQRPDYSRYLDNQINTTQSENFFSGQPTANDFFKDIEAEKVAKPVKEEDWAESFQETKKAEEEFNEQYNKEFWDRLQDEWKKLSEDNTQQHPWLNEFGDYYDPYKEYKFDENNPMVSIENAFEKGKTFLQNGDIPSAVNFKI